MVASSSVVPRLFFLQEIYPLVRAEDDKKDAQGKRVGNPFAGMFEFYHRLGVKEPRLMPPRDAILNDVKKSRVHLCWNSALDEVADEEMVARLMGAFDSIGVEGLWSEWTTGGDFGTEHAETKHLDNIFLRAGSSPSEEEKKDAKQSQKTIERKMLEHRRS